MTKLKEIPGAIAELRDLVKVGKLSVTSPEVMGSNIYKAMQTITELDASKLNLPAEEMLLLAKIAAVAPRLESLNISNNNLGRSENEVAVAVVEALSRSKTLTALDISSNNLKNDAIAVATFIAESNIREINISSNMIYGGVIEVSKILAKSKLSTVIMQSNDILEWELPRITENFAESKKLRMLDISKDRYALNQKEKEVALAPITKHNEYVREAEEAIKVLKEVFVGFQKASEDSILYGILGYPEKPEESLKQYGSPEQYGSVGQALELAGLDQGQSYNIIEVIL